MVAAEWLKLAGVKLGSLCYYKWGRILHWPDHLITQCDMRQILSNQQWGFAGLSVLPAEISVNHTFFLTSLHPLRVVSPVYRYNLRMQMPYFIHYTYL